MGHVDVSHAWGDLFKHTKKTNSKLVAFFYIRQHHFLHLVVSGGTGTSHSETVVGLVVCFCVMVVGLFETVGTT